MIDLLGSFFVNTLSFFAHNAIFQTAVWIFLAYSLFVIIFRLIRR